MSWREERLGSVLREGSRHGLRYVRELGHPPEKVWRALTESQHLRHWMPCDVVGERRVGAELTLPFWPEFVEKYGIETPTLRGKVLVWDPPRCFAWSWDSDELRFELEPTSGGTRLTFTTWLGGEVPADKTAAGYHACLDCLRELLDTGAVVTPLIRVEVDPMERRYAELLERVE